MKRTRSNPKRTKKTKDDVGEYADSKDCGETIHPAVKAAVKGTRRYLQKVGAISTRKKPAKYDGRPLKLDVEGSYALQNKAFLDLGMDSGAGIKYGRSPELAHCQADLKHGMPLVYEGVHRGSDVKTYHGSEVDKRFGLAAVVAIGEGVAVLKQVRVNGIPNCIQLQLSGGQFEVSDEGLPGPLTMIKSAEKHMERHGVNEGCLTTPFCSRDPSGAWEHAAELLEALAHEARWKAHKAKDREFDNSKHKDVVSGIIMSKSGSYRLSDCYSTSDPMPIIGEVIAVGRFLMVGDVVKAKKAGNLAIESDRYGHKEWPWEKALLEGVRKVVSAAPTMRSMREMRVMS